MAKLQQSWEKENLFAGAHRLEAFKLHGKESIDAKVIMKSDLQIELIEIDENLIRNELHYTERSDLLARKKEIYEELYPETKAVIGKELAEKRWNNATVESTPAKTILRNRHSCSKFIKNTVWLLP